MPYRQLAPSGTPIALLDLFKWLLRQPRAIAELDQFEKQFRNHYQLGDCFFFSSGRAAMYLLLRALHAQTGGKKNIVIVPTYTCYSVPASAIRAGLRVRAMDIDPDSLSYNLEELESTDFSNVLAIVSANLYGLPNDLPAIERIARENGVFFVDDAAQSLGAKIGGKWAGDFGDAGLYSLDKGKNITSIQGGILTTRSPALAKILRTVASQLPVPPWQRTLAQSIQLVVYGLLLRPWLYWIPAGLPFLKLGTTRYEDDYPVERYSANLGVMASLLFRRIDTITRQRQENAERYFDVVRDIPYLHAPNPAPNARAVYLRFPLVVDTAGRRDRLLFELNSEGLGATGSYPRSILDVPEIQPHLDPASSAGAAGRSLATRILTLPTHSYVQATHVDHVARLLQESG